jgi:hypothetical protein
LKVPSALPANSPREPAAHPDGLPHVFVDRSLGRVAVPRLLRAAGLRLTTLAEHYGVPQDEDVADVTWIEETARLGWVAFMKDARIRHRPAEQRAVLIHGARCFYITRQDLPGPEMARWLLDNLPAIITACADPGPFVYAVHAAEIRKMEIGTPRSP